MVQPAAGTAAATAYLANVAFPVGFQLTAAAYPTLFPAASVKRSHGSVVAPKTPAGATASTGYSLASFPAKKPVVARVRGRFDITPFFIASILTGASGILALF